MGGFDTRVTETTKNVFLEAAHFAPSAVIGRGRKLGLHTDASHRFERGVDPELPRTAIEVATRLVIDIAGGTPGPTTEAVLPEHLPQPASIPLRRARLARVLGLEVADAERSEEHTSELQSLMRISYAVFCLKKQKNQKHTIPTMRQ